MQLLNDCSWRRKILNVSIEIVIVIRWKCEETNCKPLFSTVIMTEFWYCPVDQQVMLITTLLMEKLEQSYDFLSLLIS